MMKTHENYGESLEISSEKLVKPMGKWWETWGYDGLTVDYRFFSDVGWVYYRQKMGAVPPGV